MTCIWISFIYGFDNYVGRVEAFIEPIHHNKFDITYIFPDDHNRALASSGYKVLSNRLPNMWNNFIYSLSLFHLASVKFGK